MSKSLGNVVRPARRAGALRHGRVPLLPAARHSRSAGDADFSEDGARHAPERRPRERPRQPREPGARDAAALLRGRASSRWRPSRPTWRCAKRSRTRAASSTRTSRDFAFHRGARGALAGARPREQVRDRDGALQRSRRTPRSRPRVGAILHELVRGAARDGPARRAVPARRRRASSRRLARLSRSGPRRARPALGSRPSRPATAPAPGSRCSPRRKRLKTIFKIATVSVEDGPE